MDGNKPVLGCDCLGTRLLSQIPESPPGLFEGFLERRELERGRQKTTTPRKVMRSANASWLFRRRLARWFF